MVYCNGTTDVGQWACCNDTNPIVTKGVSCSCPAAPLAFQASRFIPSTMSLPQAPGGTISCLPDYTGAVCPTYLTLGTDSIFSTAESTSAATTSIGRTSSITAMSSSGAGSSSSNSLPTKTSVGKISIPLTTPITTPSATSTAPNPFLATSTSPSSTTGSAAPQSPSTSGLKTQEKVGIGVGTVAGAIVAAALIWLCVTFRKRRCRKQALTPIEDQIRPRSPTSTHGFAEKNQVGGDDPRSPTWSGHKSELPANEDPRNPSWSGHKSELPADESPARSPAPTYQAYNRSSTASELVGQPMYGGPGRFIKEGLYEMPA